MVIYTHTVRSRTINEIEGLLDFLQEIVESLAEGDGGWWEAA